mgnify:CR=1 FL=1
MREARHANPTCVQEAHKPVPGLAAFVRSPILWREPLAGCRGRVASGCEGGEGGGLEA